MPEDIHSMYRLSLVLLREDSARDYLATLGLLRLFDLLWPATEPHLEWDNVRGFPTIVTSRELGVSWVEELLLALQNLIKAPSPLVHGKIIKTSRREFRAAVLQAVEFSMSPGPLSYLPVLLYGSYSSQNSSDEKDLQNGDVEPSRLSFANGQSGKNLLLDVSELIAGLTPELLRGCLEGTGCPTAGKSLRWNHAEFRPAAYRSHDPGAKTSGDEHLDHAAFNVLAFVGLSFYPTVPSSSGAGTLGFFGDAPDCFRWPIWSGSLNADEVATLVHQPLYSEKVDPLMCIRAMGVIRAWKSRRFSSDKSLYFAPAELVF